MDATECFKIRISLQNKSLSIADNAEILYESHIDSIFTLLNPLIIEADPFLFVHNNRLYLFFEHKPYYGNGIIQMIHTDDLKHWSSPTTVLREPFHLSFPYIFKNEDIIYMIPETSTVGEIRLYRATNNSLTQFSQVGVLLKRQQNEKTILTDYSDSVLHHAEKGLYYLFTTVNYNGINHLELYISSSIHGPFTPHPLSPVVVNNKYGRNAGCIIVKDGELYRPAQDCEIRYGDNVHLFKITDISPTNYHEELVTENLLSAHIPFYAKGGHQFNEVPFRGMTLIATDAKEYKIFRTSRYMRKILRTLNLSKY